jgi:hypothetical protein
MNLKDVARYRLTGLDANEANAAAIMSVAKPFFMEMSKQEKFVLALDPLLSDDAFGIETVADGQYFGLQIFDGTVGFVTRGEDGQIHIICQITDARFLTREILAAFVQEVMRSH